jgi:hypothetical protein
VYSFLTVNHISLIQLLQGRGGFVSHTPIKNRQEPYLMIKILFKLVACAYHTFRPWFRTILYHFCYKCKPLHFFKGFDVLKVTVMAKHRKREPRIINKTFTTNINLNMFSHNYTSGICIHLVFGASVSHWKFLNITSGIYIVLKLHHKTRRLLVDLIKINST